MIIFNLCSTCAECFLEQHSSSIFFVREQLVNCFPIPFGAACWRKNILLFQVGGNFSQAIPRQILLKYPAHHLRLIRIHYQFTIRSDFISIAFDCKHGILTGVDIYAPNQKESLLVLSHLEHQIHDGIPISRIALNRGYDTGAVHLGLELLGMMRLRKFGQRTALRNTPAICNEKINYGFTGYSLDKGFYPYGESCGLQNITCYSLNLHNKNNIPHLVEQYMHK